MNAKELAKKVALLKSGVSVMIDGNMFRARRFKNATPEQACMYCNVDCLCHGDVAKVCSQLDFMSKDVWMLELKA